MPRFTASPPEDSDYPLSERLVLGSLGCHLHDGCQDRQEEVLLRPGQV